MIYTTPFNPVTKKPLGPSVPMHMTSMAQAEVVMGIKADIKTKNTLIYKQSGDVSLCVSWIRFSL